MEILQNLLLTNSYFQISISISKIFRNRNTEDSFTFCKDFIFLYNSDLNEKKSKQLNSTNSTYGLNIVCIIENVCFQMLQENKQQIESYVFAIYEEKYSHSIIKINVKIIFLIFLHIKQAA